MHSTFAGKLSELKVELNFNYAFADDPTTCSEPVGVSDNVDVVQQIKEEEITIVEETIKTESTFVQEAPIKTENVIDGSRKGAAVTSRFSKSSYSCNRSKSRFSLKCPICEIGFNSIAQKRRHIKLHYDKQIPLCHLCGITVRRMEQLVQHYAVHKVKRIKKPVKKVKMEPVKKCSKNQENSLDNRSTKVNKENYNGAVNKFNKTRISASASKVRSKIIDAKQSQKQTNNNNLVKELLRKKKKPQQEYKATNKNVLWKAELERIYKTSFEPLYKPNSTTRYYKCSECSKELSGLSPLRKHLNVHLRKSRSITEYKCNLCERIFNKRSALSRHLKVHLGQKDFKCSLCPKAFTFKYNLQLHLKYHSQVKDFYCAICLRPFLLKIHLKNHLETHKTREEFKCPICAKVFNLKSSMKNHAKSHPGENGFQCSICPKTFKAKLYLGRHVLHCHKNTERKFKCFHCSKGFTRKRGLVIHMSSHSTVRNFKCDKCNLAFKLPYYLTQHKKKMHKM